MASQPSNTFRHDGHAYTVTMIEPRINPNGQPSADAMRTAIFERPKVTNANRGKVITVTGYFTPATFTVTGFRHPIEFETNQTPILGAPITMQWIGVGTRGGVELVSDWITQGQISLDNLPLKKLLAAAVKACAFTATTIATDEITSSIDLGNGVTRVKKMNIANSPPFMKMQGMPPLTFTRIGGELVQVKKNTKALTAPSQVEAVHRADTAPMKSPQALKRIADLFIAAEEIGREGRGYRTIAEWIEMKTNGVRPASTAQQMISEARKAGYLEKRKPKTKTKPKQRGKK
jgi:hypothetical protein